LIDAGQELLSIQKKFTNIRRKGAKDRTVMGKEGCQGVVKSKSRQKRKGVLRPKKKKGGREGKNLPQKGGRKLSGDSKRRAPYVTLPEGGGERFKPWKKGGQINRAPSIDKILLIQKWKFSCPGGLIHMPGKGDFRMGRGREEA